MQTLFKIFKKVVDAVDWAELLLLILNVGIGVAIIHHLGYLIDWISVIFLILWIVFFYLGNEFIKDLHNRFSSEIKLSDQSVIISIDQLIVVLFFSLSIIPLIQILINAENKYLAAYLISVLGLWVLLKDYLSKKNFVFGIRESISAFALSFVAPLIVLNIHGIQIHELLMPVSLFSFFQIIAFYFIRELMILLKGEKSFGTASAFIGYPTLNKVICTLIPLGFVTCFLLLLGQGRIALIRTLILALPMGALMIVMLNKISKNQQYKSMNAISMIYIFIAEISLITGLIN